jgi:hypothetical protein
VKKLKHIFSFLCVYLLTNLLNGPIRASILHVKVFMLSSNRFTSSAQTRSWYVQEYIAIQLVKLMIIHTDTIELRYT